MKQTKELETNYFFKSLKSMKILTKKGEKMKRNALKENSVSSKMRMTLVATLKKVKLKLRIGEECSKMRLMVFHQQEDLEST